MRIIFILLTGLVISCNGKDECTWSTVADLDKGDLTKCKGDSMFYYMKKFSGGYDNERKEKGIPKLPKNFRGVVWTVNNQVRWINQEMYDRIAADSNIREPFMDRKDIEWNEDTLIYDWTNFSARDSLDSWVWIFYTRDSTTGNYNFTCGYSNKNTPTDTDAGITKAKADSILKAWKIDY